MARPTRRDFLSTCGAVTAAAIATCVSTRPASAQQKQIRTLAGVGKPGYDPAVADPLQTPITNPYGLVVGPDKALYLCEFDTGYVRRMDLAMRRITTIAGNGQKGYGGDGGAALAAAFTAPHEIRFDRDGHLYVVERDAHVVRRVDARTRIVSTVAGTGVAGFSGDGGPGVRAQFRMPHSIAFDAAGNLLVCDIGNSRVRSIDMKTNIITTFAGTGERRAAPDEGPLDGAPLNGPRSMDTDPEGNIYLVLREGNVVLRIDAKTRRMRRIAGTGETGFSGDGGPAVSAKFNGPKGIAYGADGSVYIADTENHAIRRVDLKSGMMTTVIGTGERGDGPDGDPLRCRMARPHGVFLDGGILYVSDSENHRIRVLT